MVENHIMAHGAFEVAKHYITYRYTRSLVRKSNTTDDRILALMERSRETGSTAVTNAAQRDYIAGEVSRDITFRVLLPGDIAEAHDTGVIHFHDADHFAQHMQGSCLVNLADMLQNGTVIAGTLIETPHSFATACSIATQIVAQVAANQCGGQTVSLAHLAPFVDVSRQKLRSSVREEFDSAGLFVDGEQVNAIAEKRLREEIRRGVQAVQYQIMTLPSANGRAPLVTVFMYLGEARSDRERDDLALLIEETMLQRLRGVKNGQGAWISPASPRLLYVLEEDNALCDSRFWYLTRLAMRCTARCGVPDYVSEKLAAGSEDGAGTACRVPLDGKLFLPPLAGGDAPEHYGRFSQGTVTLNLADAALSSGGNIEAFRRILDERLELCRRALLCRHERLKGTLSDAAPILWQYGACARLRPGESVDRLLYGGYSALTLGFAGLRECVVFMTGRSHADPSATPFALDTVRCMADACRRWTAQHNVAFVLCGTDQETVCRRFAVRLRQRFGDVEDVTDRPAVTGGFRVGADASSALTRLTFEAQFQALGVGGAVRAAMPDPQSDPEAAESLAKFLYENVICAE